MRWSHAIYGLVATSMLVLAPGTSRAQFEIPGIFRKAVEGRLEPSDFVKGMGDLGRDVAAAAGAVAGIEGGPAGMVAGGMAGWATGTEFRNTAYDFGNQMNQPTGPPSPVYAAPLPVYAAPLSGIDPQLTPCYGQPNGYAPQLQQMPFYGQPNGNAPLQQMPFYGQPPQYQQMPFYGQPNGYPQPSPY